MPYTDYYNDIVSGNVKNIYAFFGPEKFIMNSMIEISKKKFVSDGLESIDLIDFDARGLTYKEAKKMFEHLPFGSDRRLLIMRNPDFIDSDKWERKKIDLFLEFHKSAEHILSLLIFDKLDNRKYGVKALSKIGKVVEFSRINRDELIRWIEKKFKESNKIIERNAINYIADNSLYLEKTYDSDLGKLYTFIQVLIDSVKHDRLSLNDVREHMALRLESSVFKWVTALLSGRAKESIYYLQALLNEGEPPIKLLYMVQNKMKDLYFFSLLKSSKLKDTDIAKLMGKQLFMLKDLNILFKSRTYKNIACIMQILLEYDDMMKIGGFDQKLVLQNLAFKIEEVIS